MTLHRIRINGGYGWRINAGCVHFEADTVAGVCEKVRANVLAIPEQWQGQPAETIGRWARQVFLALEFLASMVNEETP